MDNVPKGVYPFVVYRLVSARDLEKDNQAGFRLKVMNLGVFYNQQYTATEISLFCRCSAESRSVHSQERDCGNSEDLSV